MKIWIIPCIAILSITICLVVAMFAEVDGGILAGGLALIGGIAGYSGKSVKDKIKKDS